MQTEMSFKQRFIITVVATLAVAFVHNYSTSVESTPAPTPASSLMVQASGG